MSKLMIALLSLALLAACAPTDPIKRYSGDIDRAHAVGAPILIFKRPADDTLSFINVSSHAVSAVELKLAVCGVGAKTSADLAKPYWLHILIKGDFQPGYAFDARNLDVSAIDANGNVLQPKMTGFDWHSIITDVWVRFADGTAQRAFTDPRNLLTPKLVNACPAGGDEAHGDEWLRSLVKD